MMDSLHFLEEVEALRFDVQFLDDSSFIRITFRPFPSNLPVINCAPVLRPGFLDSNLSVIIVSLYIRYW